MMADMVTARGALILPHTFREGWIYLALGRVFETGITLLEPQLLSN